MFSHDSINTKNKPNKSIVIDEIGEDYHINVLKFLNKSNNLNQSIDTSNNSRSKSKNDFESANFRISRNRNLLTSGNSQIKPDLNDPFWAFNDQSLIESNQFKSINTANNNNHSNIRNKNSSKTNNLIKFDSDLDNIISKNNVLKKDSRKIDIDKIINNIQNNDLNKKNRSFRKKNAFLNLNNEKNISNSSIKMQNREERSSSVSESDRNSDTSSSDEFSVNNISIVDLNFLTSKENVNKKKQSSKNRKINKTEKNQLFDIVERENTNFSTKFQYDNTISKAISPHTYLDLVTDQKIVI
jgi:hypothetical protein